MRLTQLSGNNIIIIWFCFDGGQINPNMTWYYYIGYYHIARNSASSLSIILTCHGTAFGRAVSNVSSKFASVLSLKPASLLNLMIDRKSVV